MKLYDLLLKIKEEETENSRRTIQAIHDLNELYTKTNNMFERIEKAFKNGDISEEEYRIQKNAYIKKSEEKVKEQEKVFHKTSKKYADMLTSLYNCRAFISNNMLLELLKTSTGKDWIIEEKINPGKYGGGVFVPASIDLRLKNEDGENYPLQGKGYGNDLEQARQHLRNINWFQEFIQAREFNGNLCYAEHCGLAIPKPVVKALLNFFKKVDVDENNLENLSFESKKDKDIDKKEEFLKPHNLYYRFMKDKKTKELSEKTTKFFNTNDNGKEKK